MNVSLLTGLMALAFFSLLAGCGSAPANRQAASNPIDLSSATLPQVAAEFKTTHHTEHPEPTNEAHEEDVVDWRFWRGTRQITIERPQLGVGEYWQVDGRSMIHRKLYHNDRRAIEFQADDLRMLETAPSWQKLSLLLDQSLLERLTAGDIQWPDGYPVREYQGKVADSEWHIIMRMDLALPILIERHDPHGSERTELTQVHPLSAAPWQPTPIDGYDVIDFADLGDKEYDPFVAKILSQMGHDHHH